MHTLVQLQWKRGASGGEKFVHILKTRCGVSQSMDTSATKANLTTNSANPVRTPLQIGSVKDSSNFYIIIFYST